MSAVSRLDEGALVRGLRDRSLDREAAFAEVFAAYRVRVFTVCRHLTRSAADAEDATQETFVALLRALPSFRGDAALSTFIHRVAVRVAVKHRTRHHRHESLRAPGPQTATADAVEAAPDRQRVWEAMAQLSLEQRTVLALFAVDGLGHREIAAVLGVPEGTVWSRLHAARKRLCALVG